MIVLYVGECPICSQGRQVLMRAKGKGCLFICCEECDSEWADIAQIESRDASTTNHFGPSEPATPDQLHGHSWAAHVVNHADLRSG